MGAKTLLKKMFLHLWLGTGIFLPCIAPTAPASTLASARADSWVTTDVRFPSAIPRPAIQSNLFATLRAELWTERLKILWSPEPPLTNATVILHLSADELGHWPARDWRPFEMSLRGKAWEVYVPVDQVDVPLVYFVTATIEKGAETKSAAAGAFSIQVSPMRVCYPRLAGLEEPTRLFWPFLEGFEQDTASWRFLAGADEAIPLKTDAIAVTGRAALVVPLREGKRSVTVATTRVRGWQLVQQGATGLRVYLRTRAGTGRARFTLLAEASTPNQIVSLWEKEPILTEKWQKVDMPFSDFPKLAPATLDLFAIEFIGEGPLEFLVDDLQLLGPWRESPEL